MKLSQSALIFISGALWFAVGLYLLPLGIHFLLDIPQGPLLNNLKAIGLQGENGALVLLVAALALGYFKSRKIFSKTVIKGVAHIRSLPPKAPIWAVYTPKYLALLGTMILLGLSMKWFAVPLDIRGFVDVAVGAALLNGSILYFRSIKSFSVDT